MFSTKVIEGANKVADAVLFKADNKAPKKITCITKGIFSSTSVGSTFCGSSLMSCAA